MTLIQRLAPGTRLLLTLGFSLGAMLLARPMALVVALGGVVLLALVARVSWRALLRRLLVLEGFLLVMLVLLPFTVPGTPLFAFMGWEGSEEGLRQGITFGLRVHVVALAALALLGDMEMVALARALVRLGMPETLVHVFLFTVRYVAVLEKEYQRLALAMRARGFRPSASLHCWRSYGQLFGMLLVRAVERAERIDAAMRCRGFTGRLPSLGPAREAQPGPLDWAVGSAASVLLLLAAGMGA